MRAETVHRPRVVLFVFSIGAQQERDRRPDPGFDSEGVSLAERVGPVINT